MEREGKFNIYEPKHLLILFSEIAAIAALSFSSIWTFSRLTSKLLKNNLEPFKTDMKIMSFLESIQTPGLTKFMERITLYGSLNRLPFIAAGFTLGFFTNKQNRTNSFKIPVIAVGCEIMNLLFKAKYKRIRPEGHGEEVRGWSYPSGHAMVSMSFYGFLIYLLYKMKAPSLIAFSGTFFLLNLILLIGVSRSYLKAHYPSDVVVGYSLGAIWLSCSLLIVTAIENERKNRLKAKEVATTDVL